MTNKKGLAASDGAGSESQKRGSRAERWRVEGQFDDDVSIEIRSEDDSLICEIEPFLGAWTPTETERAHLIAAAPELLEACIAVKEYLGNLEVATGEYDPLMALRRKFHAPLLAKLDPAIAKATARPPSSDLTPQSSPTTNQAKDPA